ncbi:MAG: Dam family site-specific DNA-(adenine-N6)-methyltransferase [Methylococcaceae bacterium]
MKVNVPPIKSQGIKTKLVPWINTIIPNDFEGVWIEPFMGTGVVAFNIAPKQALLCDTNPHLINFYNALLTGEITADRAQRFLIKEGATLLEQGESHYYAIRERFNKNHQPLDFLFLNRSGFNGMIRFNRKGELNIPFCRKPQRFAQAYITKIVNQIDYLSKLFTSKHFIFKCQDFNETIKQATSSDIIYCDPPYIDRYVDYYNGWGDLDELNLYQALAEFKGNFILSTWHHNDFRENTYIKSQWNQFTVLTKEHFYHVGGKETNRNPVIEALVINFDYKEKNILPNKAEQLSLFNYDLR